jgi:hypothetical protein
MSLRAISRIAAPWRDWVKRCSLADCSKPQVLPALTGRHAGVELAERWYCCADCFQNAAEDRILELSYSSPRPQRAQNNRIPLGLLLHSRGILTAEQLKHALESQRATGSNFGEAVQQLGYATAEQVTAAVAAQWGCPVFPLGAQPLATQVRIPARLLTLHEMLPVHFSEKGRVLLIGFVSRVQYQVMQTIEEMTGCTVQPCFITHREYQQHRHSISVSDRENELCFEQTMNAAEMARIIRNYVVQLGAAKSRIGVCRDMLWARIWGRKSVVDLLFRLRTN